MSVGAKGIHSLGGLVAFRFFLGIVEAGYVAILPYLYVCINSSHSTSLFRFFPGVMLLLSCWYKVSPASLLRCDII